MTATDLLSLLEGSQRDYKMYTYSGAISIYASGIEDQLFDQIVEKAGEDWDPIIQQHETTDHYGHVTLFRNCTMSNRGVEVRITTKSRAAMTDRTDGEVQGGNYNG